MKERLFEENLSTVFLRKASKRLDKTALIYYGRKFTFEDLVAEVIEYATLLNSLGIKPGDRVALMMINIPQLVFGYRGVSLSGALVVPVNTLSLKDYKPMIEVGVSDEIKEVIKEQIKDSQPKVIIALDFYYPVLSQIEDELKKIGTKIILTGIQDYLPFPLNKLYPIRAKKKGIWIKKSDIPDNVVFLKDLLRTQFKKIKSHGSRLPVNLFPGFWSKADDVSVLLYTGGTTGIPKGAMLTHHNLLSNLKQCRKHMGDYVKDDYTSMLGVLPFYHSFGMTVEMNMALLSIGAPLILVPDPTDIKGCVKVTKKHRVKGIAGVPRFFERLGDRPELATKKNFKSVELIVNGAGPLPRLDRETFERLSGAKVFEGYGLTEASPTVSVNTPDDRKEGSAGKPLPDTKIKIVDLDTGEEIPAGTKVGNNYKAGEVIVFGPQVMKGYWQKPEETAEVLKNGWLRTGDIGYIDEDGFLFITDREKDMYKKFGENVFPFTVENSLAFHPWIKEIKVVGTGLKDEKEGEKGIALVVLNEGGQKKKDLAKKDILDFAKQKLAKYKIPDEIIVVSSLDKYKDALGKVLKRKIREDIKSGSLK